MYYIDPKDVIHISNSSTRGDSPSHQIFHLQEDSNTLPNYGNRLRRNRDQFSQELVDKPQNTWENTQKFQNTWDDSQDIGGSFNALRVQLNANPEREYREQEREFAEEDFSAFQFPDDLSRRESLILRNGLASTSQNVLLTGSSAAVFPNVGFSVPLNSELGVHPSHINGFEADLEDDITKMAAQRDQQRGNTIKFNRGMMGPILSKDDDNHRLHISRRLNTSTRFRSESMLDLHDEAPFGGPEVGGIFREQIVSPSHYHVRETFPFHPLQTIGEGRGPPKKRTPSEDFLNDFNTRDIMAQSIKRHSLRGTKFNPLDIRSEDPYNRIKLGIKSPSNFTVFQPDAKSYQGSDRGNDRQTPFATEIPSNHDDVQILNLQGFMDSDMRGQTAAPRAKSRRSNVRRIEDSSPIDSTRRTGRPRRKKKSKQLNKGIGNGLDETDEVVLKDIDDIDEKMASLVVGPKSSFKDTSGRPITFDEAVTITTIANRKPVDTITEGVAGAKLHTE
ncbi:hypothetical protein Avbf_14433 [Armadillidium vulgare]|nr:hypothetical protein Avbf_14433 [Armadillidium vulgare]